LLGLLGLGIVNIPLAQDTLLASYFTTRYLLLFGLYLFLLKEPELPWLIGPLLGGLTIQSLVALGQFIKQSSLGLQALGEVTVTPYSPGACIIGGMGRHWLRAYGLTQHPNILGGVLTVSLLLLIGWYSEASRSWRLFLLPFFLLGTVALLTTFSRAAWLGFIAGIGLILAVVVGNKGVTRSYNLPLLTLGALVGVVSLTFIGIWGPLFLSRLRAPSLDERLFLMQVALILTQRRLGLGVGNGNFTVAFYQLTGGGLDGPHYQPVHDITLLATAELGPLGGALWLWLLLTPWSWIWVRRKHLWGRLWFASLSAALLALYLVGFFDFYPWFFPQGQVLLWIIWGLWAREATSLEKETAD
jgi:O-antigen ligase